MTDSERAPLVSESERATRAAFAARAPAPGTAQDDRARVIAALRRNWTTEDGGLYGKGGAWYGWGQIADAVLAALAAPSGPQAAAGPTVRDMARGQMRVAKTTSPAGVPADRARDEETERQRLALAIEQRDAAERILDQVRELWRRYPLSIPAKAIRAALDAQ